MLLSLITKLRRYEGGVGFSAFCFLVPGLYKALVTSSPDYYQGEVARIMYIHVPFAEIAMLSYTTLSICSVWYLWKRDPIVDNVCHAAAGISVFFTTVALMTGSIWAKPTWNTWWTWDPRLISFAVLLMILVGYLMLRRLSDDTEKRAAYSATLAIVGFIDLPIVHFSVEWWRTLHQPLSVSTRGVSIGGDMKTPLILMSIGFSILFVYMLMVRTQMLYLEYLLEGKQGRLLTDFHRSENDG